jgi:hypothetical protein
VLFALSGCTASPQTERERTDVAMLGKAALAMWWDMAPAMRAEFEDWHSHEHFPERLSLPGFLRASRWAGVGSDGFFVMYELEAHDKLSSPEYLARLNDPTPWSRKLMPHHANMVRSQCEVVSSRGAVTGRHVLTLRSAPGAEVQPALDAVSRFDEITARRGIAGAHLLETRAPRIDATAEQKIRSHADREAGWILLFCGYESRALEGLAPLCPPHWTVGRYELSLAALPTDLRD